MTPQQAGRIVVIAWRALAISFAMALIFGLLSFYRVPSYEKGAWAVIDGLALTITSLLSFLFGAHMPTRGGEKPEEQPAEGQNV